jgi:hypothetical protein
VVLVGSDVDMRLGEEAGAEALLTRPLADDLFLEAIHALTPLSYRQFPRASAALDVEYFRSDEHGKGITKDISAEGLFLMSKKPLEQGNLLSMTFDLPVEGGRFMAVGGEVVRTIAPDPDSHLIPGAGIRFRGLEPPEKLILADYAEAGPGDAP